VNRTEKNEFVTSFNSTLKDVNFLLVTHYKGLTVSEITELREKVKTNNATFKVTKNSLIKRAIKNTDYEKLDNFFVGPTSVTYSKDPVSAAKAVFDFSKENEKLKIIAASMGDKELSVDDIEKLAALPSMDELKAKILGLLTSPMRNIASIFNESASGIVRVINAKNKNNKN
jgi:large subunit ribosomal protein L10